MKILNTATSFTHIFKKTVLKTFEQVEHSTNLNFYHYYHTKSFIITIITTTMTMTNILKNFDVLQNFPFTTSETKPGYLKQTGICELSQELPNYLRLKKFQNNVKKCPVFLPKRNFCQY